MTEPLAKVLNLIQSLVHPMTDREALQFLRDVIHELDDRVARLDIEIAFTDMYTLKKDDP